MFVYLSLVALLVCILHCYFKYNEKTRMLRKIPGPKDTFFVGNSFDVLLPPVQLFNIGREYARTFNGIYSFYGFLTRFINIYNPEDIEIVTSTMKHIAKSPIYVILRPWLRDGLLLSDGSKWQHRRKILTPSFHFNILTEFVVTFEENSCRLVDTLMKTHGEPTDVIPVLSEYTLNSICETAMGTRLDEDTNNAGKNYKEAVYRLGKLYVDRYVRAYLWPEPIFNLSSIGRISKTFLNIVHSFSKRVIQERKSFINKCGTILSDEEKHENSNDVYMIKRRKKAAMLDLLISAEKEGMIGHDGVQEEVDTFMFEGHDTTASGLIYCLMLLANNKDIQEKIKAEMQEIFGDSNRSATMEDLSMMRYLENCIKESLRLYPPVPFIGRKLSEAVKMSGCIVPAGTYCHIHIYDLHRREDLFKNALVFDPDRFLPENSIGRHPYAYIPFSAGPRNCIGQRFAMLEMKSCLAAVLRKFELLPVTQPFDLQFMADLVLRNTEPVYVKFVERQ